MTAKNRTARIRLLGGLDAIATWTDREVPGREEGEIQVHPTWARNNPEDSRGWRAACAEADRAAGRELAWSCITG